jgi:hypothetical protein
MSEAVLRKGSSLSTPSKRDQLLRRSFRTRPGLLLPWSVAVCRVADGRSMTVVSRSFWHARGMRPYRKLLRPELAAPLDVWPSSQLARCAAGHRCWQLRGDVAVLARCTPDRGRTMLEACLRQWSPPWRSFFRPSPLALVTGLQPSPSGVRGYPSWFSCTTAPGDGCFVMSATACPEH